MKPNYLLVFPFVEVAPLKAHWLCLFCAFYADGLCGRSLL
jgi:hypothetical protein